MYQLTELTNGIRVVYESIDYVNSVTLGVWIGTGSAMESKTNNGVSHFLEHMFFKGTERYTPKQLAERIENLGGQLNALTAKEYTCFYDKVLAGDLAVAVDTLYEMLRHSKFAERDIDLERKVIAEEINMSEDTPEELIHDLLAETLWPDHPLGRPVAGTIESIAALGRSELLAYYHRQYSAQNIVISAVGRLEEAELIALLEEKFGGWENNRGFTRSPSAAVTASRQAVRIKDTEQCQLCLGLDGVTREDEDYYELQVVNALLGGSMSSRLFQSIREDAGLAYSVYSYTSSYSNNGLFAVYVGLNGENIDQALCLTAKELKKLKSEKLAAAEVEIAKTQLKANLAMGMESMSTRMSSYGKSLVTKGIILPIEELVKKIDCVTPESTARVIERIFRRDRLNLALIGNTAEKDYLSLLDF